MSDAPVRKKRPRPPTPEEMVAERRETRRNGFIALGVLSVLLPTLFVVNLVREKHRRDEEMGFSPAKMLPTENKGTTKVLDNEDDLEVRPSVVKPSRHDVAFSIGSVLGDAKGCFTSATPTTVQATWQVNPDGSATDVSRPPSTAYESAHIDEVFACVALAVKQARVAPFEGAPVHVTYTFRAPTLR